jgi:hypothetical protein
MFLRLIKEETMIRRSKRERLIRDGKSAAESFP